MTPAMRLFAALMVAGLTFGPTTPPAIAEPSAPVETPKVSGAPVALVVYEPNDHVIGAAIAAHDDLKRAEIEATLAWLAEQEAEARREAQRQAAAARRAATGSRWDGCRAPMEADPEQMQAIVVQAAAEYGVDARQLLRIPPRESGWNPAVQNCSSGACGLFQHLPSYWPGRAEAIGMPGADCRDPLANARAAALLFSASGFRPWAPSGPY